MFCHSLCKRKEKEYNSDLTFFQIHFNELNSETVSIWNYKDIRSNSDSPNDIKKKNCHEKSDFKSALLMKDFVSIQSK